MKNTKNILFNTFTYIWLCFVMYMIYLMILITVQYVPIRLNAAFLAIKYEEIKLKHYQVAFFTHVFTSIFVLIFGLIQYINIVRLKFPRLHKCFGKIYISLVLVFAAPSGLVIGYYGNGGIFSQISFCLLAIFWFTFTFKSFISIRKNEIKNHIKWMNYSYALTLSAISLRFFKFTIVQLFELEPMDTYKIVVWLGWIFNLYIAYLINKNELIKFK